KMNAVLVITVLGLAVGVNPALGLSPCQRTASNNAFNRFVRKHVLQAAFDTNSKTRWESYLRNLNLCDRPRQSFVSRGDQQQFVEICNGNGKRQNGNLCTSTRSVQLYDLRVRQTLQGCIVTNLRHVRRYVTVACDKVNNICLPVHFDSSQTNRPSRRVFDSTICGLWFG
uniref:Uncharacterized protein n=1 Tax=Poecilia formosa TaxID=48698 RepID=A0A096M875_POEFO